jgi:hypothetical protein
VVLCCLYIPDSRIVCPESHYEISLRVRHEGVSAHRDGGEFGMVVRIEEAGIWLGSPDDLEVMTMQVERVLACIIIVEDNLDNLTMFKDEGVGIPSVDCSIRCSLASGKDGIQCWNLWCNVCYVVEEGTVTTSAKQIPSSSKG